ncbi:Mrp/NBP35 family ATP-binding protein [Liberibacter crescens]|uniref:Mrp/NBP35 family ATP-binding protein n=1 Tax=Liberibacter crescens TaxID=1273132 RepID=UPI00076311BC|nr:Mrp/NBP35 family ATP-binding protein [Liberibacter crescens]AMC12995.1 sodium:proton antiporter [Liberibacter crescens]
MNDIKKEKILQVLETLYIPESQKNIVDMNLVSEIFIVQKKVYFSITVPMHLAKNLEPLRLKAQELVIALPEVKDAIVTLTSDQKINKKTVYNPKPLPGVCSVIAVASGKGGVGKSTTAVNLALALQNLDLKVAILDADIYGPSLPRLLNIQGKPEILEGEILKPMENYNIKVMSIGFLVDEEAALIWRGPMVQSALIKMLKKVNWGQLDILIVDMPPGTGDAQLTIVQQISLSGVVIVSTPQDLALIDARRAVTMFNKVQVPVLGIVENMSYFIADDTGLYYDIYGRGGASDEAKRLGVEFLGALPFDIDIRISSDIGMPIFLYKPEKDIVITYQQIASQIWEKISSGISNKI